MIEPAAPPAFRMAGKRRWLALKAAITLGLLAFLATKVEWPLVQSRLAAAALGPLALAVAILIAAVPLTALRWMMLARRAGARMSFGLTVQLNFAGLFFGQVLPASVGGDAVRGWLAYRSGLPWPPLVSSLVLDRIIALTAAVVLILASVPWLLDQSVNALTWTAWVAVVVVAGLIAGLFADLLPWPRAFRHHRFIAAIFNLIALARTAFASRAGALAVLVSVLIHLTTIVAVALIGASLGLGNILMASLLVVPTTLIAAAVPVSLNGWGVREGMMVVGFALFGIGQSDAFLLSVALGFAAVISALPGGLTWLMLR